MGQLQIIFDGPPGPESGRFVEVEDENGHGVNAGDWQEEPNGPWALVLKPCPECAEKDAEIAAWKDRFRALTGHDSPDMAGNVVIRLRAGTSTYSKGYQAGLRTARTRTRQLLSYEKRLRADARRLAHALVMSGDHVRNIAGCDVCQAVARHAGEETP